MNPNYITAARIVGAVGLLLLSVTHQPLTAFWLIYAFCGITDMADGYIARRFSAVTKTGELLCGEVNPESFSLTFGAHINRQWREILSYPDACYFLCPYFFTRSSLMTPFQFKP